MRTKRVARELVKLAKRLTAGREEVEAAKKLDEYLKEAENHVAEAIQQIEYGFSVIQYSGLSSPEPAMKDIFSVTNKLMSELKDKLEGVFPDSNKIKRILKKVK